MENQDAILCGKASGEASKKRMEWMLVLSMEKTRQKGNGITPDSARMLFDAGADVITTGNHVLKRKKTFQNWTNKTELSVRQTIITVLREPVVCLCWTSCAGGFVSSIFRDRLEWNPAAIRSRRSISCYRNFHIKIFW